MLKSAITGEIATTVSSSTCRLPVARCHMHVRSYIYHIYYNHKKAHTLREDYRKELQSPYRLNKHDVAEHLGQYATNFHLNVILSTTIGSTSFNTLEKKWTVKLKAADGSLGKTIISKHFVQASGIGSQKPYLPALEDQHTFKGLSIHSAYFRNAQSLLEQGIRVSRRSNPWSYSSLRHFYFLFYRSFC